MTKTRQIGWLWTGLTLLLIATVLIFFPNEDRQPTEPPRVYEPTK